RDNLLRTVYALFTKLHKGSPEYNQLAESGDCWYNYFDPGNIPRYGYERIQERHSAELQEVDLLRANLNSQIPKRAASTIHTFAHQSTRIEHNTLSLSSSLSILLALENGLFDTLDSTSIPALALPNLHLPKAETHLPNSDSSQTVELRNHIIANHWVVQNAPHRLGTPGLDLREIQSLNALLLKDTVSEALHKTSWNGPTPLGSYRRSPIRTSGATLTIYPYHLEVPSLLQKWIYWRNETHEKKLLLPLILACHIFIFFQHIHPFLDGNGRVGRVMMMDFMMRQGMLPVVYLAGELDEDIGWYGKAVGRAQDRQAEEFVEGVLRAELGGLRDIRETMKKTTFAPVR
ncbi:hypothetical protein K402DRAFT_324523, partial [Aulographum hederae CBS 113979]